MPAASTPRKTPCASCPFRKEVPSGIWSAEEYAKLPRYDEPTYAQPVNAFACHQGAGEICSGWLGFNDPLELLAVRIGIAEGRLDPSCAEYTTDVPLHESGRAAAMHGLRDLHEPSEEANRAIDKVVKVRSLTDNPIADDRPRSHP